MSLPVYKQHSCDNDVCFIISYFIGFGNKIRDYLVILINYEQYLIKLTLVALEVFVAMRALKPLSFASFTLCSSIRLIRSIFSLVENLSCVPSKKLYITSPKPFGTFELLRERYISWYYAHDVIKTIHKYNSSCRISTQLLTIIHNKRPMIRQWK